MRLSIHSKVVVACFAATLFTQASGETVNSATDLLNNKRTAAYMHSPAMQELLYKLGVAQDRKFGLQQECKSEFRVVPYSVSIFQSIEFPEDKPHPIKGAWNMRYQLQRCGESKFYNAIFVSSGNGDAAPAPRAHYPGTTRSSPLLVRDAMPGAVASAVIASRQTDCKDIDMFDMRVSVAPHDALEGDKQLKGVWKETWTFRMCGQMVDIGLTFVPDATGGGTRFMIDPVKSGSALQKP